MVVTRLDVARRLGSLLAVAGTIPFAFAEAGFSPQVARDMTPLSARALAGLMIRDPERAAAGTVLEKALAL